MTDQEQHIIRELPHSLELTRNAKGDYQWSIKAYAADLEDLATLPARLEALDADLKARFVAP